MTGFRSIGTTASAVLRAYSTSQTVILLLKTLQLL